MVHENHAAWKLRATRSAASIERGRWVTNKVDHTVNRFCKNCNTTWMSAIVSEASPLLKRMIAKESAISLTSDDQTVLARAAYLTALSADFAVTIPAAIDKERLAIGGDKEGRIGLVDVDVVDPKRLAAEGRSRPEEGEQGGEDP